MMVCGHMIRCMWTCMEAKGHQVSSATPPPHFRRQGLLLHLDWLDRLVSEFHGSTCSARAGVTGDDQYLAFYVTVGNLKKALMLTPSTLPSESYGTFTFRLNKW